MQIVNESPPCICSTMPSQLQDKKSDSSESPGSPENQNKYFQEIGAEMQGNILIIRVEKDKNKNKKQRGQWDPLCDCEMVEIRRPSGKEGPKIVNGGDNNQILFRIHSKNHLNIKDDQNYKPQTIAYKVGPEKGEPDGSNNCRTITVHPQLGGPGTQEVFSDHITEGNQDIFLLKIKKKDGNSDHPKRNVEVELRTPKPPPPLPTLPPPKIPLPPKEEEKSPAENKSKKGEKGKKGKDGKKKK